jgi:hypothetical protein
MAYEAVSEPRAVTTGSGRVAKFISARFTVILFGEVSFLIRGDLLIRSLPLAVLTRPVSHPRRLRHGLQIYRRSAAGAARTAQRQPCNFCQYF